MPTYEFTGKFFSNKFKPKGIIQFSSNLIYPGGNARQRRKARRAFARTYKIRKTIALLEGKSIHDIKRYSGTDYNWPGKSK